MPSCHIMQHPNMTPNGRDAQQPHIRINGKPSWKPFQIPPFLCGINFINPPKLEGFAVGLPHDHMHEIITFGSSQNIIIHYPYFSGWCFEPL